MGLKDSFSVVIIRRKYNAVKVEFWWVEAACGDVSQLVKTSCA
jgi:hypothetical protein